MKSTGIKKYKLAVGILLIFVSLFLTGCGGMKSSERNSVLARLDKEGYIDREDDLEQEWYSAYASVPTNNIYNCAYRDSYGDLYSVKIEPQGEGRRVLATIYYDVELGEDSRGNTKVEDYSYCEQVILEEQTAFLILKTYVIIEGGGEDYQEDNWENDQEDD